jgi:hypothetical protein
MDLEGTAAKTDCAGVGNLTDRLTDHPPLETVIKQRLVKTENTLCVL